jgi:polysaccharide export outer membrane protein
MLNKSAALFIALLSGLALFEGCATRPETVPESETLPIQYGKQSQVDSRINSMAVGAESAATEPSTADTPADPDNLKGLSLSALENLDNYRIGPEDVLEVYVFGVDELTQTVRVNSAGYISLPLIEQVKAAGLSSEELAKLIEAKLAEDYLQDPHVSIFIKEFFGQRVTIAGAVHGGGIGQTGFTRGDQDI